MAKRWYVVQTRPNHENIVVNNLINQRFEVYLPIYLETYLCRGKMVTKPFPLFPSYLFVAFDIALDRWRAIGNTKGAVQLLTATEDKVYPLPVGFVEELISDSEKRGYISPIQAHETIVKFTPGDQIRVRDGVFTGMSGTCGAVKNDRVTILLSLLSGKVKVDLPSNILSLV